MLSKAKAKLKKVNSILVSQPKPVRSPYFELEGKYGLQIDFRKFIHVEGVSGKEFRKSRIKPDEYTAVIFTSKNAVDHFFRTCEELRIKMSQDTKYFCLTKAIALYLQKYIVYRKRKVFFGKRFITDLKDAFKKHSKERFLLPCTDTGRQNVQNFLENAKLEYTEGIFYKTVSSDLSDLSEITYDVLIFFSPLGIKSLFENFPSFKQNDTRIAVFGKSTKAAAEKTGLKINILAPAPDTPSMTMALEKYLLSSNENGNK